MRGNFSNCLSNRLFFSVISTALLIGILLSIVQIMMDAQFARQSIKKDALQALSATRNLATQAASLKSKPIADQVMTILQQNRSIQSATIVLSDDYTLNSFSKQSSDTLTHSFLNMLFNQELRYSQDLTQHNSLVPAKWLGRLEISMNSTRATELFVHQTRIILFGALVQILLFGLLIYLIFRNLIAKPMTELLASLEEIDPMHPSHSKINVPTGHHFDEMGAWIQKTNDLFKAIENYNSKRRVAEAHVERLSNYDMLTELPNRNMLLRQIDQSIQDACKSNTQLAILYCALDDFKSVNLLHSYHAGDKLLLTLADRFRSELEPIHTISRVGGDVFAIIITGLKNHYQTADITQKILNNIRRPFHIDNNTIKISATIGITIYPHDAATSDQLLKNAENVMQLAKSEGGNHYQFYVANVDQKIRESKVLEKQLAVAVEENQFELNFQPQVDLVTGEIKGAEALIRWHNPEQGIISPAQFISLAERTGAIIAIGEWVLEQACTTLKRWHDSGLDHLTISINVSTLQLHQSDLITTINNVIRKTGVSPNYVVLEITETAVMENVDTAIRLLKEIKQIGFQLAIDDFGTGYSSLSYLKKMPLDEVKIDRSFVQDRLEDPNSVTIVDAIIQLSHSLGLTVIAEGAETDSQIRYLQDCECDIAQGYFYSPPVKEADLLNLIHNPDKITAKHASSCPASPMASESTLVNTPSTSSTH